MPETQWSPLSTSPTLHTFSLIPTTPTLRTLCPSHSGRSFPPLWPYICYARDMVVYNSQRLYLTYVSPRQSSLSFHRPYLTYAMSETRCPYFPTPLPYLCCARQSLIPTVPTLHTSVEVGLSLIPTARLSLKDTKTRWSPILTVPALLMLCPRHGGLSFLLPLPYICYTRDTVLSHSHRPTLHTLCPRPVVLFPWPVHNIYYFWDIVVIPTVPTLHTICPRHGCLYFSYAMSKIRCSLILTAATLHMVCPRYGSLSYSLHPYLIYARPKTRWSLIPNAPILHMLCTRHSDL